jgi:hypothetical protein
METKVVAAFQNVSAHCYVIPSRPSTAMYACAAMMLREEDRHGPGDPDGFALMTWTSRSRVVEGQRI